MRGVKRWIWRGVAVLAAVSVLYVSWVFLHVYYWVDHNPSMTSFMQARQDELRERNPEFRLAQQWVPYERISIHLKRAIVVAEDARFLSHGGFDWAGIQEAMEKNIKKGKIVAGGSTISQQLAKNLFLDGERTLWRKAHEAFITVVLEAVLSKRRILELYLNVIEWGDGIFGAEVAAKHYFRTSAANLTPEQAAWLAAMVPNPRYYDKRGTTRVLQRRAAIILARMPLARVPVSGKAATK